MPRRFTLHAHGSSMWPLVPSGAALEVEACEAAQLRRGDIAVLLGPAGAVVAHRVLGRAPGGGVRTAGDALGCEDAPWPPGAVLGRVVAIGRGPTRRSLPLDGPVARAVARGLASGLGRAALTALRRTRARLRRAR